MEAKAKVKKHANSASEALAEMREQLAVANRERARMAVKLLDAERKERLRVLEVAKLEAALRYETERADGAVEAMRRVRAADLAALEKRMTAEESR